MAMHVFRHGSAAGGWCGISARQAAEQLKITHRTVLLWVKEKAVK
jgi:hypothetical protein